MKKTNRKAGRKDTAVAFRFPAGFVAALDKQAARQGVSRTQLVETYCRFAMTHGVEFRVVTKRSKQQDAATPAVFE